MVPPYFEHLPKHRHLDWIWSTDHLRGDAHIPYRGVGAGWTAHRLESTFKEKEFSAFVETERVTLNRTRLRRKDASMQAKKQEEKNLNILKELRNQPENRRCMDCLAMGQYPQYVVLDYGTWVCAACSGIHREFNHKIKSPSMSTFKDDEVQKLTFQGNGPARDVWRARWSAKEFAEPEAGATQRIREFIRLTYVDKKWYSAPPREDHHRQEAPSSKQQTPPRSSQIVSPTKVENRPPSQSAPPKSSLIDWDDSPSADASTNFDPFSPPTGQAQQRPQQGYQGQNFGGQSNYNQPNMNAQNQNFGQQNQQTFGQSNQPNYNQPNQQSFNQQNQQNYNQPNQQNYNQPNQQNLTPQNQQNFSQQNQQNYNQPNPSNFNPLMNYNQPNMNAQNQPMQNRPQSSSQPAKPNNNVFDDLFSLGTPGNATPYGGPSQGGVQGQSGSFSGQPNYNQSNTQQFPLGNNTSNQQMQQQQVPFQQFPGGNQGQGMHNRPPNQQFPANQNVPMGNNPQQFPMGQQLQPMPQFNNNMMSNQPAAQQQQYPVNTMMPGQLPTQQQQFANVMGQAQPNGPIYNAPNNTLPLHMQSQPNMIPPQMQSTSFPTQMTPPSTTNPFMQPDQSFATPSQPQPSGNVFDFDFLSAPKPQTQPTKMGVPPQSTMNQDLAGNFGKLNLNPSKPPARTSNPPAVSEDAGSNRCPICTMKFPAGMNNTEINKHIDECLNEGAISDMDRIPKEPARAAPGPSTTRNRAPSGGRGGQPMLGEDEEQVDWSQWFNLSRMDWYFGAMEREEAEKILRNCSHDSFLVRKSSIRDSYAVSFFSLNKRAISHTLIEPTHGGYKFKDGQQIYPTLIELIQNAQETKNLRAPPRHDRGY
ncbi:hypothetical protein PROFUN_02722 [Planoprotostelium fungivorum]|uniref:Arf-GAP domain-containing protein n=1 Tax=Planoprotostelium fungivorum TaxID=1890364 RepID=A0A2P6NVJ3_9EUKA|nr:hypothetical protein PROFUN_02722 [Planoprotostelium fungivorum]